MTMMSFSNPLTGRGRELKVLSATSGAHQAIVAVTVTSQSVAASQVAYASYDYAEEVNLPLTRQESTVLRERLATGFTARRKARMLD